MTFETPGFRCSKHQVECNLVDRANDRARIETHHAGGGWRKHLARFERELENAFFYPVPATHA